MIYTIETILNLFPETSKDEWTLQNRAWVHSSVKISNTCFIWGGVFRGGEFVGGEFRGGEFRGGVFRGGVFVGGEFRGGVFRGGVFRGGVFRGGMFWSGEFWSGEFMGGEFRGGVFRGGVFRGGEFWSGELKLQIQGSKHFINSPDGENLKIGREIHPIGYWVENYKVIGKKNNYTKDEIIEYKMYIDLFLKILKKRNNRKNHSRKFKGDIK